MDDRERAIERSVDRLTDGLETAVEEIHDLREDIRKLSGAIHGDGDKPGLFARLAVVESRLATAAVSGAGSAAGSAVGGASVVGMLILLERLGVLSFAK